MGVYPAVQGSVSRDSVARHHPRTGRRPLFCESSAGDAHKACGGVVRLGVLPLTFSRLLPRRTCVCSVSGPTFMTSHSTNTYILPTHTYRDKARSVPPSCRPMTLPTTPLAKAPQLASGWSNTMMTLACPSEMVRDKRGKRYCESKMLEVVVIVMVMVVLLLLILPSLLRRPHLNLKLERRSRAPVLTPAVSFSLLLLYPLYLGSNPGGDYAPLEGQWKDGLCECWNQWSPSCLLSFFVSCVALAMLSKRTGVLPYW